MIQYIEFAHIAQSVEHVLGKNGVTSSNLVVGCGAKEVYYGKGYSRSPP